MIEIQVNFQRNPNRNLDTNRVQLATNNCQHVFQHPPLPSHLCLWASPGHCHWWNFVQFSISNFCCCCPAVHVWFCSRNKILTLFTSGVVVAVALTYALTVTLLPPPHHHASTTTATGRKTTTTTDVKTTIPTSADDSHESPGIEQPGGPVVQVLFQICCLAFFPDL